MTARHIKYEKVSFVRSHTIHEEINLATSFDFFGSCDEPLLQVKRVSKAAGKSIPDDSEQHPKWKIQSLQMRQGFPLERQQATPWSLKARLQGLPKTDRVKEMVDLGYLATEMAFKAQGRPIHSSNIVQNLSIDVSQNCVRRPWGNLRTFCTGSQVYLYQQDRVLIPQETLRLLGFGCDQVATRGLSDKEITDLAGNAMSVPSVALCQLALLHGAFCHNSMPWLFQRRNLMEGSEAWAASLRGDEDVLATDAPGDISDSAAMV